MNNKEARTAIHKTERIMLNLRITEVIKKKESLQQKVLEVGSKLERKLETRLYEVMKQICIHKETSAFEKSREVQKKKFQNLLKSSQTDTR